MHEEDLARIVALDKAHVWHPFTPMKQWRESEPLVIVGGEGEFLMDGRGRRYIDGVSSLWCNVHGHRVPEIDRALRDQLDRIAHTTFLGLTNVPAVELAAELCRVAPRGLRKVFYSDSGATATEVAFKMAVGYGHHSGRPRHTFIALEGAYHGDTFGAMSVGYSDTFHRPYKSLTFHTEFVPPHDVAAMEARLKSLTGRVAGIVIEPLVQGAAGMVMQPPGYLRRVADLAMKYETLLIADEVATGFGRTGRMFACEHEGVEPDILCLGKGLSGGYLPLAATLCTDAVEQAFCGEPYEFKTLYHGHTFTGNPLACAAALASLRLFEQNKLLEGVNRKAKLLGAWLDPLRAMKRVKEVRQCGLMVGVELYASLDPGDAHHAHTGGGAASGDFGETSHPHARRPGHEVCVLARERGVLLRPLGNVVVVMPPLTIADENLKRIADVLAECIVDVG